jgi:hypothetical protein
LLNFLLNIRTYWRLGFLNLLRVGWYRVQIQLGIHTVQKLKRSLYGQIFFNPPENYVNFKASLQWNESARYFGVDHFPIWNNPPNWNINPFTGSRIAGINQPWWQISDFGSGVGDIKIIWEASRFDWVLAFAQRAAIGGKKDLHRLNLWLSDWIENNQAYQGPNWKCGQEASIRVIHLLLAAIFLQQERSPREELIRLIEAHLARIAPTIEYAVSQDNNHGSSEAAALFIGGSWLKLFNISSGASWQSLGRYWLENRITHLIDSSGSFSQHSVNYHRLILDTLSFLEFWRRRLNLPTFSETFYGRAKAATKWLFYMTDPISGDAPNLGANDGVNLLPLTNSDYRDYRPSIQLANLLFYGEFAYPEHGDYQNQLTWLGLNRDLIGKSDFLKKINTTNSHFFYSSGYIVLRKGNWKAIFRYPLYRFRPSQCDALHIDFWYGSTNLFRDSGSYSYNTDSNTYDYFSGVEGHNTIQFDDREQMPKVKRFLRGKWLIVENLLLPCEDGSEMLIAGAGYRDWQGASHYRKIALNDAGLCIIDTVSGFQKKAVLRWRLPLGDWEISDTCVRNSDFTILINSSVPIKDLRIVDGWESRYYLSRDPVKVLEVCVTQSGQLTTVIRVES